jgi:hypothetical protein
MISFLVSVGVSVKVKILEVYKDLRKSYNKEDDNDIDQLQQ